MSIVSENLERISANIAAAAARAGRNPHTIELMAVTKTLEMTAAMEAIGEGITLFGENRIQEATSKYPTERSGYRLHLIGHLQRNKIKFVPGFFDCVESIDKAETAEGLSKRCELGGQDIDILFELNTSGEENKSGFEDTETLKSVLDDVLAMQQVHLRGLMTIGPFTSDCDKVRRAFANLRRAFEIVRPLVGMDNFDTLSMGMSSDYEIAIEEGATRVRLGTALFGSRRV